MSLRYSAPIRNYLATQPHGAVANDIAAATGLSAKTVRRCCDLSMPDVYIDRWTEPVRGQYQAVWMLAHVPANCPHPRNDKRDVQVATQWRSR